MSYPWPNALDFEVYMRAKRDSFTGRAWLFEQIEQWLCCQPESRALLLTADYGVGKSAFLAEHVARWRGQRVLAWHFCRHDRPQTLDPGRFVRSVAAQLAQGVPEYRQSIESAPALQKVLDEADEYPSRALEMAVLSPLAQVTRPTDARLLLVDALDESLAGSAGAGLVELLAQAAPLLPSGLRLLVSSRPVPEVLIPLQAVFKAHEIVAEDAQNLEDLRQYVLGAATRKDIRRRLDAQGKSPDWLAQVLRARSGGKFLFVLHALRELADGTLMIQMLQEVPPEGMDGFYRLSFRQRFGTHAEHYGEARAVLGVMCAAHEPLSLTELAQMLELSEAQVLAVQEQIPDFIKRRAQGPRSELSFDHLSLKEWLTFSSQGRARAGDFGVDLTQSCARILRWAQGRVTAGDAHTSPYLLRHLATYLRDDRERQAVYARLLLKSFEWSQARLGLSGVAGLLADVAQLRGHPGQPWLRALIHQAEPALRESMSQWPAQVLGRVGTGRSSIGLESLATAAQRWALAHSDSHTALLPMRRSLSLRAGLQRRLQGQAPLAVLPGGRIAFVRGKDVCVADSDGQDELRVLNGHNDAVDALAVLPEGRVVSASWDRVRVWSLDGTGAQMRKAHGVVRALTVLPGSRVAESGGNDDIVRVWSVHGGDPQELAGHTDVVHALAMLPDGRLVSGDGGGSVRVWSLEGGSAQVLEGHTDVVSVLAVLPDGRLASGSWDNTVRVWSLLDGAAPRVLEGHSQGVLAMAVLPDGRLVSGGWDRSVRVWCPNGTGAQVLEGHTEAVLALAVLPDGRVASGSDDKSIRIWPHDGGAPQVLEGHTGAVEALAVLPDGRLVSGGKDQSVRVWRPDGGGSQVPEGHTSGVCALAMLPDGRFVSGSMDKSVRIWPLEEAAALMLEGHTEPVIALAVLPDGRVASGSWDCTVRVWSSGGQAVQVLQGHRSPVSALAVLPDGRVVSGSRDKSVRVWSLDGDGSQALEGHEGWVTALTVLADGRLASGGYDNSVRVWSATGGEPQVLEGHSGPVTALAVLPDGRLISGSMDETVRVWSLQGGDPQVLEGHSGAIEALAVLPDGRVVSGSTDNSVRVWSLEGSAHQVLEGHSKCVRALAVLADGRMVSGSWDGSVRLWSPAELQRAFIADAPVDCLCVSPAGMIAAGCYDGTVHVLRLP